MSWRQMSYEGDYYWKPDGGDFVVERMGAHDNYRSKADYPEGSRFNSSKDSSSGGGGGGAGVLAGLAGMSGSGEASIGLAAFQVWSGFQQAEMIRRNADLKAREDEMNAEQADIDAYEAEKMGYTEQARYQSTIDSTIADQRKTFAAQNVDVNSGTAKAIQQESRLTGYLNLLDIQKQARERARGFKNEARNYRLGGQSALSQGAINASGAQTEGIARGVGTGIRGAESIFASGG